MIKLIAKADDEGRKLFKYLQSVFKHMPTSHLYKILRKKDIKINSKRTNDENLILHAGDLIEVYGVENDDLNLYTYDASIKLTSEIIYEDDNILILNKQNNVEVHGSKNSLDNQVLSYLNYKQDSAFKVSHVGRLDKETSGLIIYAKNYAAVTELNSKIGKFDKIYTLKSDYNEPDQIVSFYIHHDEKLKKMMATNQPYYPDDKKAETYIFKENNKLYAKLLTGKKHQIRVTMAYLNWPIYGDKKYGGKPDKRLFLHSYKLTFKNLEGKLAYLNNKTFICEPNW
ncbi:RluA family pseudouridine synthase [Mycoplasmopsis adleri]|uniref:RluA family pseudouridine synthase n=1 Tax=Mycoplasmopsis adleri TaxID=51362 RepID=UPI0038734524